MTVAELLRQLATADPASDVCVGPGLRLLGDIHIQPGVPGQVLPYIVLLATETSG